MTIKEALNIIDDAGYAVQRTRDPAGVQATVAKFQKAFAHLNFLRWEDQQEVVDTLKSFPDWRYSKKSAALFKD
jgi:hypothetical protein